MRTTGQGLRDRSGPGARLGWRTDDEVSAVAQRPSRCRIAWIRAQPPAQIGAALHDRFMVMRDSGLMAPPARPAGTIVNLLTGQATGQVADASGAAGVRPQG